MSETRPCRRGCGALVPYQGRGPTRACDTCDPAGAERRALGALKRGKVRDLVPRGCPLTGRQLQLLKLLADGLTYGGIAEQVGISISTVRTHLHSIYMKLGARDRAQAVLIAHEETWLDSNASPGRGAHVSREIRLLRNVEQLLQDVLDAVGRRRERLHITAVQEQYLRELDKCLRASTQTDVARHGERMGHLVDQMLMEAGLDPLTISRQHPRKAAAA